MKNKSNYLVFSSLTVIAAAMGIAADFLLGFVRPGSIGRYSIAQTGWAEISLWRPGVSMLLAAIAFPLYLFGIYVIAQRIAPVLPRISKAFWMLSIFSSAGWLLSHVFFCFPQYAYAYLAQNGQSELALTLADKLLWMLFPALLVYAVLMAASLGVLFAALISGKTPYPGWVAFLSPFTAAALFSTLRLVFPESTFILALTTASVHVGMLFLFAVVTAYEIHFRRNGDREITQTKAI